MMVLFLNLSGNFILARAGKGTKETKETNDTNETPMS